MIDLTHWEEAQKSEAGFWGQCLNGDYALDKPRWLGRPAELL